MSEDFDPATAASVAQGDDDPTGSKPTRGESGTTEPDTTEATADTGGDNALTALKDALMQTEPSTDLSRIENPWQPDEGGAARIHRAIQKMTSMDGTPAAVDLLVGALEMTIEGGGSATIEGDSGTEPGPTGDLG